MIIAYSIKIKPETKFYFKASLAVKAEENEFYSETDENFEPGKRHYLHTHVFVFKNSRPLFFYQN